MTQQVSRSLYERSSALVDVGRVDEAMRLLPDAIAANPDDPLPYCLMSLCLYELGDVCRASEVANQALTHDPNHEWGLRLLALALARIPGSGRRATEVIRRAISLRPNLVANYDCAAGVFLDLGAKADARAAALHGLSLAPNDTSLIKLAAFAEMKLGHFQEAVALAERALAIDPNDAYVHNLLGSMSYDRSRYVAAMGHYLRSIRVQPDQLPIRNLSKTIALAFGWVLNVAAAVCGLAVGVLRWRRPDLARLVSSLSMLFVTGFVLGVWLRANRPFRTAMRASVVGALGYIGLAAWAVAYHKAAKHWQRPVGAAIGGATFVVCVGSGFVLKKNGVLEVAALSTLFMSFALLSKRVRHGLV
jgi:tetratricopeptide (TPR) repeat protein